MLARTLAFYGRSFAWALPLAVRRNPHYTRIVVVGAPWTLVHATLAFWPVVNCVSDE